MKKPDVEVEIQGHNDNIGSDRYNPKLSLKRAETVKNFLIAKGIAADRGWSLYQPFPYSPGHGF